jgi:putative transposase
VTAVLQATTGRLYPTAAQARAMARIGGQCRALWNRWLAVNAERHAAEGRFAFYAEMSAALPAMRKEDRFAGLPHRCAQMTVQRLDRALRDCAKAATPRKGFPRFKRRDDRRDAFRFVGREVRVEPGRIGLPALGWVRVRGLRVPDAARLVQVTVRQDRGGWVLALQMEAPPPAYPVPALPPVGIDAGLTSLVALSTGEKVEPPRPARASRPSGCGGWSARRCAAARGA